MKVRLAPVLVGAVLALLTLVLVTQFTWVEEQVDKPLAGEAATNPLHATHQLVRRLGGRVVSRPTPEHGELPPPDGTLYLNSSEWRLVSGRLEKLRQWVEQGGHLVMPAELIDSSGLSDWLPFTASKPSSAADDAAVAPAIGACQQVKESPQTALRYPGKTSFQLCVPTGRAVQSTRPVQWSVNGAPGALIAQVTSGAGSVTLHSLPGLFDNRALLAADHALLVAAMLQIAPGREVWFVHDAQRDNFLTWLWRHAWVAVCATLLAIGAALWRAVPRFGPAIAPLPPRRRSMGEQITGTAQFFRRHAPKALHAAALRALDETAQGRVRRYHQLSVSERAQAIAQHSGLPADTLAQAMLIDPQPPAHTLVPLLQLLETARRRLRPATPAPANPFEGKPRNADLP